MRLVWASIALLPPLLSSGCADDPDMLPPRGQILLFIDTDAPLPPAPGAAPSEADEPPWLFDRLRVDVLGEGADSGTAESIESRDFALHRGLFGEGPVSLGIVPNAHDGRLLARARLYRARAVREGEPLRSGCIDSTVTLPEVGEQGVSRVLVRLAVQDTGKRLGPMPPLSESEISDESLVGSWPGAQRKPCPEPAAQDEACVPGGAFWMGDLQLRDDSELVDADQPRLVVVSPFYIDLHEVTVGELRPRTGALSDAGLPPPVAWSGSEAGLSEDDYATFTAAPHPNDPDDLHALLPVNAISWESARSYCQELDKDLPSEAMYEFLASGRGREQTYVWGDEEPACDEVVMGRAGFGPYAGYDGSCRLTGSIGGALPAGSGKRDRIELGDSSQPRVVLDLAGNLSEWALDWLNAQDEGIWASADVLQDPIALEIGAFGERRVVRGGSWRGRFIELRAAARVGREFSAENRAIGFRCARHP